MFIHHRIFLVSHFKFFAARDFVAFGRLEQEQSIACHQVHLLRAQRERLEAFGEHCAVEKRAKLVDTKREPFGILAEKKSHNKQGKSSTIGSLVGSARRRESNMFELVQWQATRANRLRLHAWRQTRRREVLQFARTQIEQLFRGAVQSKLRAQSVVRVHECVRASTWPSVRRWQVRCARGLHKAREWTTIQCRLGSLQSRPSGAVQEDEKELHN